MFSQPYCFTSGLGHELIALVLEELHVGLDVLDLLAGLELAQRLRAAMRDGRLALEEAIEVVLTREKPADEILERHLRLSLRREP